MPNQYEREIEEILRNLETTEPKAGLGQKVGERFRRKPPKPKPPTEARIRPQRQRRNLPFLKWKMPEWLIAIAVLAALISGGFAYASGNASVATGLIAIIGTLCLFLVVLLPFISRSRSRNSRPSPGDGNVTPLRRSPLSSLSTRWNLFLLKRRYRRKNNRNGS
jgi:hypothetical protein